LEDEFREEADLETEEEELEAEEGFREEEEAKTEEELEPREEETVKAEEEELDSCKSGDGDRDGDTLDRVEEGNGYTAETAKEASSDEDEEGVVEEENGKGDEDT
jgi:hypothetical protein